MGAPHLDGGRAMRRINAQMDSRIARRAYRVIQFDDLAANWTPELHFLVPVHGAFEADRIDQLVKRGLTNVCWIDGGDLEDGDVVIPEPRGKKVLISYRNSDLHHALFLTNRCNSYCL